MSISDRGKIVASIAALGAVAACIAVFVKLQKENEDVSSKGTENNENLITTTLTQSGKGGYDATAAGKRLLSRNTITVAYASTTGTCQNLAQDLCERISRQVTDAVYQDSNANEKLSLGDSNSKIHIQCLPINEIDFWDEFLNQEEEEDVNSKSSSSDPVLILFIPTWTNGVAPPTAQNLFTALDEIRTDWRVASNPLGASKLRVAAFGMGSTEYDISTFCKPAKEAIQSLTNLGATNIDGCEVGMGDDANGDYKIDVFEGWANRCINGLVIKAEEKGCQSGNASASECCSSTNNQNDACACIDDGADLAVVPEERDDEDENDSESFYSLDEEDENEPDVMDLEDLGVEMKKSQNVGKSKEPKEMVTPKQAAALKKEGYKLIGTHSAVKLCRWTKHQLRGRGGCYKHTFYGITSYQCMEATPSLACANKCVFCWRHHKNPVGKEWRWKTDDPKFIVKEAVKEHVRMIKEAKGIPGVRQDRWKEAHTVRHCALSLVGEPIMYPRIKEFLEELHNRHISTYLVTNGQHPQAIESLNPITQLYVSVDAPTPESLEAIDRPLFKDAWSRLRQSLSFLKAKGQRTVARLTVVKGWNSDEIEGYAKLIALGHCSFVEVKGVTFCGKSDASNLNMSNTPWHHEVVQLCTNLRTELNKLKQKKGYDDLPDYDLACEHKHSCSVLLARTDQFSVDDPITGKRKWRTWIDYDKFQELVAKSKEDPAFKFTVNDYLADTPSWAVFGAEEEGFDPTDKRYRKKKKHPKFTKFDDDGIPTHDAEGNALSEVERQKLEKLMATKKAEIGDEVSVTTGSAGETFIHDASLMFRGLVIEKN